MGYVSSLQGNTPQMVQSLPGALDSWPGDGSRVLARQTVLESRGKREPRTLKTLVVHRRSTMDFARG